VNIFFVDENPVVAAQSLCDKHQGKMLVESVQMMVSALRRHGATDADVPLTAKGTPHKGGYANHPSTRWVGDSLSNFTWLFDHSVALADEFALRFGKEHACARQLDAVRASACMVPDVPMTAVPLCVGDELHAKYGTTAVLSEAVDIYREFYTIDKASFAKWLKGRPSPDWWNC